MKSQTATEPIEILLVEDSPADVRLMTEALADAKVRNTLHVVRDGVDAMHFLRREGAFAGAPRPDLILLDLNLPRKDGREVLQEIKQSGDFAHIPVVVLTTSDAEQDILRSYHLHANAFITKPLGLDEFTRTIGQIEGFWLQAAKLSRPQ